MISIDYISGLADRLTRKYQTRDPFKICDALGVTIRYKDLGTDIKAFYYYKSRIRNIVLNFRVSETVQKVLVAHELGHDRLHQDIAMLRGFQEIGLFDHTILPAEYEANLFAAELLIDDGELMELFNDEDKLFFGAAKELQIPAELLDFKFRVMKHKGYRINAQYMSNSNFLKNDIAGCFDQEHIP